MRDRPFISAREEPRPYSEIVAERRAQDPRARGREQVIEQIRELEGHAAEAADPKEAKRLQCEAEALRCALDEQPRS